MIGGLLIVTSVVWTWATAWRIRNHGWLADYRVEAAGRREGDKLTEAGAFPVPANQPRIGCLP